MLLTEGGDRVLPCNGPTGVPAAVILALALTDVLAVAVSWTSSSCYDY